jgi:cytochrome b
LTACGRRQGRWFIPLHLTFFLVPARAARALHLAGVATMSWLWKENLPAAMINGVKRGD